MKSRIFPLLIGLLLFNVAPATVAKETDKDTLIDSCVELVAIYESKSEKYLLAGFTTSASEAMKAGYCRGVLEEHANHTRGCYSSNWLKMARFIAAQQLFSDNFRSTRGLLEKACNG